MFYITLKLPEYRVNINNTFIMTIINVKTCIYHSYMFELKSPYI